MSVQLVAESSSPGTTMQTTQWREKLNPIRYTKSAHSTVTTTNTNTNTNVSTKKHTSTSNNDNDNDNDALNVNGKQLFQNSSRSIWDYNPGELKVVLFGF